MTNPIVPWPGGKRRLAKDLLPLFPDHQCYVELFAGGAALFFLRPEPARCEVLNDINGELVNLYRVVQHHAEEFVRQYNWTLSARQVFEWHKTQPLDALTDIQRAVRFYFLQQHSFGGRVAGQTFGTSATGQPASLVSVHEKLAAARERLSGVYIEHLPWIECARRYDREHTFFYADPPYWQTAGYGVGFPWEEYQHLAEFMATAQGKVMLSINDHPDIRELFKDFRCAELAIRYSNGNQAKGAPKTSGELVLMNW